MSRRPFSIAELAARSRPTGYDPSRSLKDLLRTATAERNAGDAAKEAGDVESAFIHYAKASTLMLEELPTHPKFGELNSTQKDAVLVHGQVILDSLAAVKSQVSERFSGWSTQHPDADPSAPTPTPQRPTPQRPQPRKSVDEHRRQEERRRQHEEEQRARRARQQQEAQRLMAEQERRQRALRKDGAAYDQVANIAARRQQEEKEREELLAEKKRQEAAINAASAAAFLGYPTPASLHTRVRPDSYESQTQPVSIVPTSNPPPPPPSAPPVSIPQAQHLLVAGPERSASAAGLTRTGSAARVHHPHPPTTGPQDKPVRAPSRTGSRADHHPTSHRPVSGPRDNPPARPGSRADHRPNAIRTDVFGTRNESAPAAFGSGAYASQGGGAAAAAAYNAAYGPGIAYGQNPNRQRKMSVTSPVRDRPPGGGVNGSHPPTTQAPVPRRRTTSHGPQKPPYSTDPTRANGVFPDIRQPAPQPGFPQPQPHETKPAFPSAFPQPDIRPELQNILPLESPSHTWTREPEEVAHVHAPAPRRNGQQPPVRGSSYPPPVTTTSPPPGPISYPNLMSHHQREQGYLPSTHSMFSFAGLATALAAERDAVAFGTPHKTTMNTPPSLLFQPNPEPTPPSNNKAQLPGGYGQTTNGYAQGQNPAYGYSGPSATASGVPAYPSMPRPSSGPTATTNYATRPPPAVPTTKDIIPPLGPPPGANYGSPQTQQDEPDDGRLRQVLLPEEVIQKFMSIAKPNTLQNRETCGLLLGKKRAGVNGERSGFAVTTLLIPRQRGSSDMCEMVEEELILEFQEARGLITLGWIHTHPTQSCFMSSLDLHTHSGYQVSLKEAFAIVCAPTQSPNVGIFRLTDPPGLQVILKCTAKEAFHPHSASSIYTDADQGHVKMMKKLDLSIVDLRRHST